MKPMEASEIIKAMAVSLRTQPPSFHYEVNATGFKAQNSDGVGFFAAPTGGGPGSTTIGMQAALNITNSDIEALVKPIADELRAQVEHAADLLMLIAAEVEKKQPDAGMVQRLLNQIPTQVVGAAISAAVQGIVRGLQ